MSKFLKGNAGRPKGAVNKTTAAVKAAIYEAFERSGGVEYLVRVAEDDPKTFLALLGRLVPSEVDHGGEVGVREVTRRIVDVRENIVDVPAWEGRH